MINKTLLLYLILLLYGSAHSQISSINGSVKDLKTSSPVEGAKVELRIPETNYRDSVFTDAAGNWRYDLLTGLDPVGNFPVSFEVFQNFPNPFNPSTKINFSFPSSENVRISVHNVLGELIDEKSAFLEPGNYTLDWFSKGSAGVYLYTIASGDQSVTKKMIQLDGGAGKGLGEIYSGSAYFRRDNKESLSFPVQVVTTKLGYAADSVTVSVSGGENFTTLLQTVHSKYTLIDLHNDILEVMISDTSYHLSGLHTENHTDIPRLKMGEVDIQFFSIWVSPTQYQNHFDQALVMRDLLYSELALNSGDIALARTMEESLILNSQNRIAAVIGVEGGHHIENSIDNLITLYNSGMRYLTITWNNSLSWAIAAKDTRTNIQGLSNFGRDIIRKLDSLGVIIDVSHVGIRTISDILEVTKNPVVATHSGARAVQDHYRNLYDWQIQAIAEKGGVVGIVFYPYFLNGSSSASVEDVLKHIDHIVNLVGTDHVAIGSDFDGIEVTPYGLEDVTKFPELTLALLRHGYSEPEVAKFLGGNFRRVFEHVCDD